MTMTEVVIPSSLDGWDIDAADFSRQGTLQEKLSFLLGYAILAPSGHNTQPWLFSIEDDAIDLYADRTRALPVIDPEDREMTISCGAALLNLRLALRRFGYHDLLETPPNPADDDLLARIRVKSGAEPSAEDLLLFDAIPKRHTNRQRFEDREVPAVLLTALQGEADDEGAWLYVVEGSSARQEVADLIAGGETMLWQDKRFRRELAAWIHPNRSRRLDGIPGYGRGLGDVESLLAPFVARHSSKGEAARDRELVAGSPVIAVIGTDGNGPMDWLAAGQALERILLRAQAEGVSASFLNQPIEVPELLPRLRLALGTTGVPQLVIRLGYGPAVKPTPRRPVQDVLLLEESTDLR